MRGIASVFIVLSSLAFAPAPVYRAKPDKRTDLDKLQGEWVRVSLFTDGKRHEEAVGSVVPTIKGDTLAFGSPGDTWRLTLDATKSPKRFDGRRLESDMCFVGVYELKGDNLVVCWHLSASENNRPASFDPAQPGVWVHVYERKKP